MKQTRKNLAAVTNSQGPTYVRNSQGARPGTNSQDRNANETRKTQVILAWNPKSLDPNSHKPNTLYSQAPNSLKTRYSLKFETRLR